MKISDIATNCNSKSFIDDLPCTIDAGAFEMDAYRIIKNEEVFWEPDFINIKIDDTQEIDVPASWKSIELK